MKKSNKLAGLLIALAIPSLVFAKGQVETEIPSDYSRNSVSKIVVTYGDKWDSQVTEGVNAIETGFKFDINDIATEHIRLNGAFRTREEQEAAAAAAKGEDDSNIFSGIGDAFKGFGNIVAKPDTLTQRLLTEYINAHNIGKEIFDYALAVDQNGQFHHNILAERSRWNATDADVHLDRASQVKRIGQNGSALLANSYLIVFDAKNPRITESIDKEGKKTRLYAADVTGYVFMIDEANKYVPMIVNGMWINPDDDAATIEQKKTAYKNVKVPMVCVAAEATTGTSEESIKEAVTNSYDDILRNLENNISAWAVTVTPEEVQPYITAKVGKKEGIKNAQRFKIYKNVERETKASNGEDSTYIYTKKVGYARATEVVDNVHVATGESGTSSFYQISGRHLKGTEFLKQSNDIKLGVSLGYNYNGLGMGPNNKVFGAFSMVDLTFDYLAFIQKNGISHYARINVGYDIKTAKDLEAGAKENNIPWYVYADGDKANEAIYGDGVSYVNVAIGYACGLRVKQVVEFQPFINIGMDMIIPHGFDNSVLTNMSTAVLGETIYFTEKTAKQTSALFIDPGLRIVFNCGYPFQLYIQGNYSLGIMQWDAYRVLNDYARLCGYGHSKGLGVSAGIKWTF